MGELGPSSTRVEDATVEVRFDPVTKLLCVERPAVGLDRPVGERGGHTGEWRMVREAGAIGGLSATDGLRRGLGRFGRDCI